jgi:hypothetical protein
MISDNDWKNTFDAEIQQAENARRMGNEGMARVCARRAAGALIGEYFKRLGVNQISNSAYERLRYLRELPGSSPKVAETTNLLLTRITMEHTLPLDADLIAEARWLRKELLGE